MVHAFCALTRNINGLGEVVKLCQGGMSKDVILNYINNSTLPYLLGADAIIHLQTLGMPQCMVKSFTINSVAMLRLFQTYVSIWRF